MKHLFIVNPAAGKAGNENELLDQIQELDLDCEVVHTQHQEEACEIARDRKSTRLNSSHWNKSRMPSSA